MSTPVEKIVGVSQSQSTRSDSNQAVISEASNELIFAVVGQIGSGTSAVADAFKHILEEQKPSIPTTIIKARDVIEAWAKGAGKAIPARDGVSSIQTAEVLQDLGDEMRSTDHSAVARALIGKIREARAFAMQVDIEEGKPVIPDGKTRAYILDSLRHPAEVNLLRHIYQDAFVLIGVVCDRDTREERLNKKLNTPLQKDLDAFMKRDEKAIPKHGQQVAKTFHLSDFFVDNTPDRFTYSETGEKLSENPEWEINDRLSRLVKIVTHAGVERPEVSETAMHHAYSAQMRSACLSRQVGAALIDANGNLLATGTNEVPKAGGGVYGEVLDGANGGAIPLDHRCVYRPDKFCSSTKEQNELIEDIIRGVSEVETLSATKQIELRHKLKGGRVGDIIEFSRAVHAEMDALLSASRSGGSTVGTRLFVTTYPCHYCARHIISAGVDEVQYIEPYFKSLASRLHSDAIQQRLTGWRPPSKGGTTVLFRPFTGVAPRLYQRAFFKERDLKNDETGDFAVRSPEWGTPWHLRRQSYVQLEAQLSKPD